MGGNFIFLKISPRVPSPTIEGAHIGKIPAYRGHYIGITAL